MRIVVLVLSVGFLNFTAVKGNPISGLFDGSGLSI